MTRQTYETGIAPLDERLDGGIVPGNIVLLTAGPTSQSERFLAHLLGDRPTLYLTTQRGAAVVREDLEHAVDGEVDCTVRGVDDDAPFEQARRPLADLDDGSTFVVDTMNPFERADAAQLRAFLNDVHERMRATESVAVLHCIEGRNTPGNRDLTEYVADVVFDLDTDVYGDSIENRLFVPKVRRGGAVTEAIKLDLRDGVTIDTSRDIS